MSMIGKNWKIKAVEIEFNEGGNTVWVHGPEGGTILRIKCSGRIGVDRGCNNICAHSDMIVQGDIEICVPGGKRKKTRSLRSAN